MITAGELIKKDIDTDASYLAHLVKSGKTTRATIKRMMLARVNQIMKRMDGYL